jgi:hypothetical protein
MSEKSALINEKTADVRENVGVNVGENVGINKREVIKLISEKI